MCPQINFTEKLHPARFWERPNRFLLRCTLEDNPTSPHNISGEMVDVHLADPGRLKELLIPGKRIWLCPASSPKRRTKWSAALVENPEGTALISIDSTLPNRLVAKALTEDALPVFRDWELKKAEHKMGNSRFDFLLNNGSGQMALEVKSVTLVKDGVALFPDAITIRGAKHVHELAEIATRPDWSAAILFVVQREDAYRVLAAPEIDPHFATTLDNARQQGVQIKGVRCKVTPDAVALDKLIPAE